MSKKGFTLLELLVVVLIIGILASIALPQYKKAVTKSRLASIKFLINDIVKAQELYYLTNGSYTTKFEDLDIQLPPPNEKEEDSKYIYDWGYCSMNDYHVKCNNSLVNMNLDYYYAYGRQTPGLRVCTVMDTQDLNDYRNDVCKEDIKAIRYYIYNNRIYWYPTP